MKCHYEVLGLARTAEDDEIKKAYRKLALRWHPDKNLDNAEEANQQFLLVQAAYDVLSDGQERAWYDNHREQILRGGHTNYEDNSVDLFQYFTTSCYKGFGDDGGGFYAVYAEVFHTIASEEIEFLDDEDDFEGIPRFGNSGSDYETEVRQFYGYWEGFCTKKSYAWLNPHNIAEIRDRRILKAIERDNKKVQQKARKERNEEIRSLVLFVKKRDKRVQAYKKLLEERAEQNRLKSAQNRLEQIRRKQREIEEQQRNSSNVFNEAYEEQLRKLEASYADASEESSDDDTGGDPAVQAMGDAMNGLIISQDENGEESFYVDDLYCVACDKMFNNKKSYENHESSRKHKQNVELLREQMRKDDDQAAANGDAAAPEDPGIEDASELSEEEEEVVKTKSKKGKNKKKPAKRVSTSDEAEEPALDIPLPGTSRVEDSDDDWAGGSKKGKKGKGKSKDSGAAKAKAVKEVKEEPAQEPTAASVEPAKEEVETESEHKCVTCNEKFGSKNKLFNHLKQTGHSVYVDKLKAAHKVDGEKPKGGKKRK